MKLYYLVRVSEYGALGIFTQGISIFQISMYGTFKIMSYNRGIHTELTNGLIRLQNKIRQCIRLRRFLSHPLRLRYREIHGCFPSFYHQ